MYFKIKELYKKHIYRVMVAACDNRIETIHIIRGVQTVCATSVILSIMLVNVE